jgi:DNA-binding NarL/FixJ family response regulator
VSQTLRIVLADDQVLFVESLKYVLEERAKDIEIIGVAHDGREAVELAMKLSPDLILMDVRMPRLDGVQATRQIHELYPKMKIVMLTTFEDDDYFKVALQFGAVGYLLKNIPPEELIRSIRAIRGSIPPVSPEMVKRLISHGGSGDYAAERPLAALESLTTREKEILDLLLNAYENKDISRHLGISEQTVKNHVHNLYEKLNVSNRIQLIKVMGRHQGETGTPVL